MMQEICDTSAQEIEADGFAREMEILAGMAKDAISENAQVAKNQEDYGQRYTEIASRYEEKKARHEELQSEIANRNAQSKLFANYIATLEYVDGFCSEFDVRLWSGLMEYVTVYAKDGICFIFRGGTTIKV